MSQLGAQVPTHSSLCGHADRFLPWWRWSKSESKQLEPWEGDGSRGTTASELTWIRALGDRAPRHCTEGWLGALSSSSAWLFRGEVQALEVRLGGSQSVQHFQLHCTPAGVSVEGVILLQSQNGRAFGRTLDQTPGHIFALLDWQEKEPFGYLC